MPVALKIEKMSVPDRLQTMERLWDSLRRNEADIPSPPWHKAELESRLKSPSAFLEWETAKRRIRSKAK